MNITPQDIIDKEFRVKFRGFDMAEVDSFLEEVAESFFKLIEENTLLNEKILALQQDLETSGSMTPRGPLELPAELGNILEELKQDNGAISAELVALKQDRKTFDTFKEKLEKVLASINESSARMKSQPQVEFPADIAKTLGEFKQGSEAMATELASLKEDRQALGSLKKKLEEVISSVKEISTSKTPKPGQAHIPADLHKTLAGLKQGDEKIGSELAALKQEVGAITGIRHEIKNELQKQLSSYFDELDAKLSPLKDKALPSVPKPQIPKPAADKKEKLAAAKIVKEPEGRKEDARLPDYRQDDDRASGGGDELEFLSEDDILDVDKLRDIFQSVLDEGVDDGHISCDVDEETADLLFIEDDLLEDHHEPEVTFSLDVNETDKKKQNH
jgi:cell division initiation protein